MEKYETETTYLIEKNIETQKSTIWNILYSSLEYHRIPVTKTVSVKLHYKIFADITTSIHSFQECSIVRLQVSGSKTRES